MTCTLEDLEEAMTCTLEDLEEAMTESGKSLSNSKKYCSVLEKISKINKEFLFQDNMQLIHCTNTNVNKISLF